MNMKARLHEVRDPFGCNSGGEAADVPNIHSMHASVSFSELYEIATAS
jgi:hypothetical protein